MNIFKCYYASVSTKDALSPEVSDGMYGKLADVASRREVFDLQMELKKLRDRPKTQGVGKAMYTVYELER